MLMKMGCDIGFGDDLMGGNVVCVLQDMFDMQVL